MVKSSLAKERPFAVAFIDMSMPGINGAETARQLWEIDPQIKIVIITAFSTYTPDDIVTIAGREDLLFLRKPFMNEEIRQFVRALTREWNLEREKEASDTKLAAARDHEIAVAGRIQQKLLLGKPPEDISQLQIAHLTIPSQKVDGDFYDFIQAGEHCLDVIVGDVMGKGIAAAILGAAIKKHILQTFVKLIQSTGCATIPEPEEICTCVHENMIEELDRINKFVTLCYTRFDLNNQQLKIVDCGHTRTIHYHQETNECSLLEGINMPIGFPEETPYQAIAYPFARGDLFFFYSDGLTEAGAKDDMFDEKRLIQVILENGALLPEALIDKVRTTIIDHAGTDIFDDDFTCVAVKIRD